MALLIPKQLSTPPSARQETWKPQFTDEQRANFERIAAIDRRANDMAYARELVQMYFWRDPRDRKKWFAETMQRITKQHGHAYTKKLKSMMTEIRVNEYENLNEESIGRSAKDEDALGQDEAGP